jgi:hypothetical protein
MPSTRLKKGSPHEKIFTTKHESGYFQVRGQKERKEFSIL